MTLPRPVLLAILGLALVAAVFLALRVSAGAPDASPAPSQPPRSAGSKPSQANVPARPPETRGSAAGRSVSERSALPPPVARALAERRPIVLFLSHGAGADEAATRRSVRSLRAGPGRARVFSDRVANIGRYRQIVAGLDVSQAPAVVIVPPRRDEARVIEGFVDAASLRQQVVDALR